MRPKEDHVYTYIYFEKHNLYRLLGQSKVIFTQKCSKNKLSCGETKS